MLKTYKIEGRWHRLRFVCEACDYAVLVRSFTPIVALGCIVPPRTQAAAAMRKHVEQEHKISGFGPRAPGFGI